MDWLNLPKERRLRRDEAVEYLREKWGLCYKPQTLARIALSPGGPKFQKFGVTPLYPQAELDRWAQSKLSKLKSSSKE